MTTKRKKSKTSSKAKTTVAIVNGIRIRERRPGQFVIQVRRAGLTHFETFSSLDAATLKCEQLHTEQVNNGLSAFEIDGRTRQDAKDAADLLADRCTLADAARLWLKHNPDGGAVTVSELVDRYMANLDRRKARPATVADSKVRLKQFAHDYGAHAITSITGEQLEQWIDVRGGSATNKNNHKRKLHAFFQFALKKKLIEANPVKQVEKIEVERQEIAYWDSKRVEAVLQAAKVFKPDMIPYLVVSAFCGLRPDEASKLDWAQVNLKGRKVRVLGETSKTRKTRPVTIPDNAARWLADHVQDAGAVTSSDMTIKRWRVRLSAAAVLGVEKVQARLAKQDGLKGTEIKKKRLGWDAVVQDAKAKEAQLWPADILRHSFATAWYAVHENENKLAKEMGNSPAIIHRHYNGAGDEDDGQRYFEIQPDKQGGKIIQIKKAVGA